ncbi:MAG: dTDP-glucose 4,6-dehydratase [Gammaproteobacteria bacterium]|jgi:dTDP-glucose 4,6-dehydratase
MKHTPHSILVTGGAGFIGCNFVRHLLGADSAVRIVNLDALTYAGSEDNLHDLPDPARHLFVKGDICDRALVDRLLREHGIDTVVHFAAESHVDRSISGPGEFVRTNVTGTFTLLEACRQYWQHERKGDAAQCRFHHISTDEVYGTLGPDDAPFTETTPYAPNSPYSASKAASDHLVRAYFHTYHLPVVTTNCSNNFGPYQHGEKFMPTVIRACVNASAIPVYGDGSNVRDWLYVGDHCTGIEAVLRGGRLGECYNIGGGNEQHNIDVVRLICRIMDELRPQGAPHEQLIHFVTDRPGHDWRYAIDARKIRDELGWTRAQRFEEEVRETVAWYLEQQA